MTARKTTRPAQAAESAAPDVQTNAPITRRGSDLEGFIWQQLNEIQSKLGGLSEAVRHQTSELSKLDEKVEQTKDKIHLINVALAVAAAVFAIVATVGGVVLKEVWDTLKPTVVERLKADPVQPQQQPRREALPPATSEPSTPPKK